MGKKGLELPLNMIVLIIIAVLVLLVVAAFFTSQTIGGFGTMADTSARQQGCTLWMQTQCTADYSTIKIYNYIITVSGVSQQGSLADACTRTGYTDSTTCQQACGCPGTTTRTTTTTTGRR